jgi:serine/threonine-protein kinase RsbW
MPSSAAPAADRQCTATRTYPGDIAQIRTVRADLRELLHACPVADQVILCASELAANAARHSDSCMPGGHFTVRATIRPGDYAQVDVTDDGGRWAPAAHPSQHHGLDIVHALAADWGIDGDYRTRTIWARLSWPRAAPVSRYAATGHQLQAPAGDLPAQDPSPAPVIAQASNSGRAQWSAVIDGQRLRHLRRLHQLSRETLADRAGISLTTLARLECETRPHCRPRTMTRLATALGEHPATITRTLTPITARPAS